MGRRKGLVALGLVALLLPSAHAQEAARKPRFTAGAATPAIPIHLASGKVHVQVRVGEAALEWFLLDSGANMTIFDRELAERLELKLHGETTADQAAGGRPFRVAFTEAPPMSLPGLEIPGHSVAVLERRTQPANGHGSSGLLGADQFRRFVVDVDYPARTIRFHDPESFEYTGPGSSIPIEIDPNGKPMIRGRLKPFGRPALDVLLSVDTGGRGFMVLGSPFVAEHDLIESLPRRALKTVGVGVGGEVVHWAGRLEELTVGPFVVRNVPASLAPPETKGAYARSDRSGVLEADFLNRFRVIFDYARERIILEPRRGVDEPFPFDASGLFLIAEGAEFDRPRIMSVLAGSPAAEAGLQVGDEILSIDGSAAAAHSLDEVRALLETAGATRTLEVEREGQSLRVTLTLRDLI